jgi:hypothetical protein
MEAGFDLNEYKKNLPEVTLTKAQESFLDSLTEEESRSFETLEREIVEKATSTLGDVMDKQEILEAVVYGLTEGMTAIQRNLRQGLELHLAEAKKSR